MSGSGVDGEYLSSRLLRRKAAAGCEQSMARFWGKERIGEPNGNARQSVGGRSEQRAFSIVSEALHFDSRILTRGQKSWN